VKRRKMLDILETYGLDERQLRDINDSYGYCGIDRFLNEPNNSVLARTQPGFYNGDPAGLLPRDTTIAKPPYSNLSSWVEIPLSPRQDEELELLSTNSSFYMVYEEGQGDEHTGIANS
jgi:hypothetical protein